MRYQEERPVLDNWQSLEVWIDPTASPPYVLMLLCGDDGLWRVLDPAEEFRRVFVSRSYEEARHWLLEDEYECVMGRVVNDRDSSTDDLAHAKRPAS